MIFTQNPLLFLWVWKLLIVSFTAVYWRHSCGKNVIETFLEYTLFIFRGVQYVGAWWPGQLNCAWWCWIISAYFFLAWKSINSHGMRSVGLNQFFLSDALDQVFTAWAKSFIHGSVFMSYVTFVFYLCILLLVICFTCTIVDLCYIWGKKCGVKSYRLKKWW
jgi:hypothetical protein